MGRREQDETEAEENSERWLLTYADMITLLLTLFIVLYSMSTIDLQRFKEMAESLGNSFHRQASDSVQAAAGPVEAGWEKEGEEGAGVQSGTAETDTVGSDGSDSTEPEDGLTAIYEELQAYVEDKSLGDVIDIEKTETYVNIRLKDRVLFYSDSPVMFDSSKPVLKTIADAISDIYGQVDHVTISGHTASTTDNMTTSNSIAWQLSSDRAVTVLDFLVASGLPETKLSVEGRSHFDPVAPNDSEENRAKNRRVEILITKAAEEAANKAEESEEKE